MAAVYAFGPALGVPAGSGGTRRAAPIDALQRFRGRGLRHRPVRPPPRPDRHARVAHRL